jgi:hypothetical protein
MVQLFNQKEYSLCSHKLLKMTLNIIFLFENDGRYSSLADSYHGVFFIYFSIHAYVYRLISYDKNFLYISHELSVCRVLISICLGSYIL